MGHALILSVYCVVSVLGKLKELLQCVRNKTTKNKGFPIDDNHLRVASTEIHWWSSLPPFVRRGEVQDPNILCLDIHGVTHILIL